MERNMSTIAADAGETSSAGKVGGIRSDPPEYQVPDLKHEEHAQVQVPGRLTIQAQSQVGDGHPDNGEGDKRVGGDAVQCSWMRGKFLN